MRARALLLGALLLGACKRKNEAPPAPPPVDAAPPAPLTTMKQLRGNSDVTFLAVSDTHFGFGGIPAAHDVLIPKLNGIAGRAFPAPIGGVVAPPRGLLVTGDLTEWGNVEEWEPFAATYGLDGGAHGKLRIPVFEVVGNHDKVHGPFVEQQVIKSR